MENLGVDKSGLRFYNFEQMQPFVMLLHKKKQVIGQKDPPNEILMNELPSSWPMRWKCTFSYATACSPTSSR